MKTTTKLDIFFTLLSAALLGFVIYLTVGNVNKLFDNDPLLNPESRTSRAIEEESVDAEQTEPIISDSALRILETIENARITAYTKFDRDVDCISASQKNICWRDGFNIIACPPKYPFETKFVIEGRVYTCLDRMNIYHRSFENHFDIWFDDDLEGALEWGIKFLDIKILDY